MMDFKSAVCRIDVKISEYQYSHGSGFFISNRFILTCNHIVEDLCKGENVQFSLKGQSETKYDAKIRKQSDDYDIAILEILDSEFKAPIVLALVSEELIEQSKLKLFGFPNSGTYEEPGGERITGLEITATINTKNNDFSNGVKYDLVLDFGTDIRVDHAGISGSPLLNVNNEVVAIFKRQESLTFAGVSIKRAISFLNENNIEISTQSVSFEPYSKDLFNGFKPQVINDCEEELTSVLKEVDPYEIVKQINADLFTPPKSNKSIDEIIKHIQSSSDCCSGTFWRGWLELLTYIKMVKGDYSQLNNIAFTLSKLDFRKLFGLEKNDNSPITGNLKFSLSFYFVEKDCFFDIAKKTLRSHKEGNINQCTIFNSHLRNFDLIEFTLEDKHNIIPNVAGSLDDVFQVKDRIHLGVLPLSKLSSKVANSSSLEDASINLIKLFEDAIK